MASLAVSPTSPLSTVAVVVDEEDPLEFEEWDGKSPFWVHCAAGSIAGVAEHVLVYPLDTVKTHIQCATCPAGVASATAAPAAAAATTTNGTHLLGSSAASPLVSSTPSTASYSAANAVTSSNASTTATTTARSITSSLLKTSTSTATTAAAAALPRPGIWTTMRHIVSQPTLATTTSNATNATAGLIRSSTPLWEPVGYTRLWRGVQTVMIGCIPAHALYFSSYEAVKQTNLRSDGTLPYWAGCMAGAAAVLGHDVIMSPLDTIKQRLQLGHYAGMRHATMSMISQEGAFSLYRSLPITLLTNIPYGSIMVSTNEVAKAYLMASNSTAHHQHHHATPSIGIYLLSSAMGGMVASFLTTPLDRIKTVLQIQQLQPAYCERYGSCPKMPSEPNATMDIRQAMTRIIQQEGLVGLFKGSLPRILSHTPAVAISWTSYETAKQWLTTMT